MIPRPEDLIRVLPETVWCLFGVLLMLMQPFTRSRAVLNFTALLGSILGTSATIYAYTSIGAGSAFSGLIQLDAFAIFFHLLVGVVAILTDPSFPSGHVVQYTALFVGAFFLVYGLAKPSVWRTSALVLLALPIVLVGPSRLYLGQHWLSDVLGGYAVAVLFLVPYCSAYLKIRGTTYASRFTRTTWQWSSTSSRRSVRTSVRNNR